jgi:hypothetical protein
VHRADRGLAAVVDKVHADIVQIAVQADMRERIAQLGLEPSLNSPPPANISADDLQSGGHRRPRTVSHEPSHVCFGSDRTSVHEVFLRGEPCSVRAWLSKLGGAPARVILFIGC